MKTTTTQQAGKRPVGRPRRKALDDLQKELGLTRRHVSTLLREAKAGTGGAGTSPIGKARLVKTLREIERLEIGIENERLEQRRLKGELLFLSEAVELVASAQQGLSNTLRGWPKTLAPRLVGQTTGQIERQLADAVAGILEGARVAVGKAKGGLKL